MDVKKAQRLDRKRRYEARCAIRRRDEQARAVREEEYLREFISEYESLHRIQTSVRRRMEDIHKQGIPVDQKKNIYDAVYRIEAEKNRRAYAELIEYKRRIKHVRLSVQAKYEELRRRDRDEETCPNCGIKRMRVQTRPLQPFWETVRNAPPGPGGSRQGRGCGEVRAVRRSEEMNEAIRVCLEERRRGQLTGIEGFIGPLPRLIGLLDDEVREGRRVWALPSPFLDPLYGRNIVSPFFVLSHFQQYLLGTWEH